MGRRPFAIFRVITLVRAVVRERSARRLPVPRDRYRATARRTGVKARLRPRIVVLDAVFVLMGLAMFMHAIAWLLNDYLFSDHVWIGFAIESLFWFIVAGVAGLIAYRSVQAGAPPVPELAIEEARRTKETLTGTP